MLFGQQQGTPRCRQVGLTPPPIRRFFGARRQAESLSGTQEKRAMEEPWSFTVGAKRSQKRARFNLLALEHDEYYFQVFLLRKKRRNDSSSRGSILPQRGRGFSFDMRHWREGAGRALDFANGCEGMIVWPGVLPSITHYCLQSACRARACVLRNAASSILDSGGRERQQQQQQHHQYREHQYRDTTMPVPPLRLLLKIPEVVQALCSASIASWTFFGPH